MANLWAKGSKMFFLAVVIGAILLMAFQALFPGVPKAEAVGVIALMALGLAALINFLWGLRKKKDPGEGKE